MMRVRRGVVTVVAMVGAMVMVGVIAGCGSAGVGQGEGVEMLNGGEVQMLSSDEAKAQMLAETDAIQAIIGEGWTTEDTLTIPGPCNSDPNTVSPVHWSVDYYGTVDVSPVESTALVQAHLDARGFTTKLQDRGQYGWDVSAFKPGGLTIGFGSGFNGAASLYAGSVCFPEE